MTKRKLKKQKQLRNLPRVMPSPGRVPEGNRILRATLPGGLMYQIHHPAGVPQHDPPRRAQIDMLVQAPIFATIPLDERTATIHSIARTYVRFCYHHTRYYALRADLDTRRAGLPGEVMWDSLVEYVHFELQAFAGAARTLLDELVYLIARKHGIPTNRAKRKPWETADLIQKPLPAECNVPEVQFLAKKLPWFNTLNAYRNSFFHHGWQHGSGHFDLTDIRLAQGNPAMNGLLLPDRASLLGRKKPFEWTWFDRTSIDDVATLIVTSTDDVLGTLAEQYWNTPPPRQGSMPLSERPNVLTILANPAMVTSPHGIFVPIFSTYENGMQFTVFPVSLGLELVPVHVSTLVAGVPAVTISLRGIDKRDLPDTAKFIELLLDPEANDDWTHIRAKAHCRTTIEDLMTAGAHSPISLPVYGIEQVWVWRQPFSHTWTT